MKICYVECISIFCTEKLTRHFKRYGEIIDSVVMRDRSTRQPRGFGFVTYADPSVIDKVIKDTHLIDGRTVSICSSQALLGVPIFFHLRSYADYIG